MLLLLCAVALVGLRPWATTSLVPNLRLSPGLGLALGDSAVVARAGSVGVADASVAGPGSSTVVAEPVTVSAAGEPPAERGPHPALGVSEGRPLQSSGTTPISSPPVEPPSTPPSETEPVTEPVAAAPEPPSAPASTPPLTAGVENGPQGGPSTAVVDGVDESGQGCEGDESAVTISFDIEEIGGGQADGDILIRAFGSDGSESELHLKGDLNDVRDLGDMLVSEGNCVQVEVEPFQEGDPAPEASETGTDAAELGDTLEPAVP